MSIWWPAFVDDESVPSKRSWSLLPACTSIFILSAGAVVNVSVAPLKVKIVFPIESVVCCKELSTKTWISASVVVLIVDSVNTFVVPSPLKVSVTTSSSCIVKGSKCVCVLDSILIYLLL